MKKLMRENVLIIGDLHAPFEHRGYLDFCVGVQKRFGCGTVVHIGDLVDNHAISYHEHDPDGKSPADEMGEADKHLAPWFKAFPAVKLCLGNHDRLVDRKCKTSGLPSRAFKDFRHIWELPRRWDVGFDYRIDGVRYTHGTQWSGKFGHVSAAMDSRSSCVMGHLHSTAGVEWMANDESLIFGMCVGCGMDKKSYAMAYGKDFRRKPVLGCGIVTDHGEFAQFIPMEL